MLEIPESQTMTRQLNETIKGKRIASVQANQSPHGFAFYFGEPEDYPKLLNGKSVDVAQTYGGLVELEIEDMRLLLGDGVNIRYLEKGAKRPPKHQLLIEFEDGSGLYCTVQMYGGMWAFPAGCNDNFYYLVAKEKISPLDAAFDETYFASLFEEVKPNASLKMLLGTEQRIPGLGNGTLQDICFRAGLHPRTKAHSLTAEERLTLLQSLKNTLTEMIKGGGRDTEKDLFGHPGGYVTQLSAKTWKGPCPNCGGPITRKAYLGGNVYYCETCQPIK